MKQTLYVMRHGETLFNKVKKIQGWCDSPLTKQGMQQAKCAGRYFKENGIVFTHAYCSSAERTADTLELVCDLPYQRLKGIKEKGFGLYEGIEEYIFPRNAGDDYLVAFGGESFTMLKERVIPTLHGIMEHQDHTCVLAVSHGGVCKMLLRCYAKSEEMRTQFVSNCMILRFAYENHELKLEAVIDPISGNVLNHCFE